MIYFLEDDPSIRKLVIYTLNSQGMEARGFDRPSQFWSALALEKPETFAALCRAFPGRVGVSLDAEGGRLKSRGWVADTGLSVDDVLPRLQDDGAAFIIYTDIDRDGMQSGVNLPALEHLARAARVPVIAAGGVATLADVQRLYPLVGSTSLVGAVSGRALYEGTLHLEEANAWIAAQGQ